MARKRKLDRLDIEAKKATDAGMSYGKWKAMQPREKPAPPKQKEKLELKCQMCGNTFYRSDKRHTKYCSPECQHKAHIAGITKYRKAHPDKVKEYQKNYREKWREANREYC